MKNVILCLSNTFLMVGGQLLFKLGANGRKISNLSDIIRLMMQPLVLSALCIYGVSTALWLFILTKAPISQAYPIQALAFPIVLLISIPLFNESVAATQWIGVLLIIIGVFIATNGTF